MSRTVAAPGHVVACPPRPGSERSSSASRAAPWFPEAGPHRLGLDALARAAASRAAASNVPFPPPQCITTASYPESRARLNRDSSSFVVVSIVIGVGSASDARTSATTASTTASSSCVVLAPRPAVLFHALIADSTSFARRALSAPTYRVRGGFGAEAIEAIDGAIAGPSKTPPTRLLGSPAHGGKRRMRSASFACGAKGSPRATRISETRRWSVAGSPVLTPWSVAPAALAPTTGARSSAGYAIASGFRPRLLPPGPHAGTSHAGAAPSSASFSRGTRAGYRLRWYDRSESPPSSGRGSPMDAFAASFFASPDEYANLPTRWGPPRATTRAPSGTFGVDGSSMICRRVIALRSSLPAATTSCSAPPNSSSGDESSTRRMNCCDAATRPFSRVASHRVVPGLAVSITPRAPSLLTSNSSPIVASACAYSASRNVATCDDLDSAMGMGAPATSAAPAAAAFFSRAAVAAPGSPTRRVVPGSGPATKSSACDARGAPVAPSGLNSRSSLTSLHSLEPRSPLHPSLPRLCPPFDSNLSGVALSWDSIDIS